MSKLTKFARHHGLSAGLVILTILYAFGIPNIRSLFDEGLVGTQFLPQLLVVITLICLAVIVLRDMKTAEEKDEDGETTFGKEIIKDKLKPIALFVATLGYIALFKPAGFVIATFLYSNCILWLFSHANNQLLVRALIGATITGLAYLLFAVAFGTHLNIYPVGF